MAVREFVRGGYRTITEPTLVSSHGRLLFTVLPHNEQAFVGGLLAKIEGRSQITGEPLAPKDRVTDERTA
jgi:hypothetical protein